MIICCECGVPIEPCHRNMCATCLFNDMDIAEHIPRKMTLLFCQKCERYLKPPSTWIAATLESPELLTLCLNQLKELKQIKVVNAGFVWTEPHSKRLKIKLIIQSEAYNKKVLQQEFIVEFTLQNHMCGDCHRIEAKNYWSCLIQVRQRAVNKKTFYYLEQLIPKHKAHEKSIGIKPMHGGLDFYYDSEGHARKFVEFLQSMAPIKIIKSRHLVKHDQANNHFYYKHTWSAEIAPLSKDSVVCVPKKMRQQLANISPICLVQRVTTRIYLIDPSSAQMCELSAQDYFRTPFQTLCDPKQMIEYVVMDIDLIKNEDRKPVPGQGQISSKHALCDIWVVRASELGINDTNIHTRSHLGHLLKVGDSVLGYQLKEANVNNVEYEKLSSDEIQDVILVRKCYIERQMRHTRRNWKLKHLAEEETNERSKYDYQEFLEDLEEDADIRKQINIYRDVNKTAEYDNDDVPRIGLDEMLQDFVVIDNVKKDLTNGS